MPPHVGHQEQGRPEAFATLVAGQNPLVSAAVLFELLLRGKTLATLRAADFVTLGLLVPPAACVLLVLPEVSLAGEHFQTCHAVDALWFALVLAIQLGQAEVAAAQ